MTVIFTGNLGRFQRLDVVVAAVLSDHPGMDRVRLVLMGEGAAKDGLARQVASAPERTRERVVLLPHGSSAQARALMRAADWGLVSLAPDVIRYAYPSKTATYLSEGLPVLAAVESDSSLVRDVEAWGAGTRLPLDTADVAARALADLAGRDGDAEQRRELARSVWRREFAVEGRLQQWDDLISGLGLRSALGTGADR
jgi:colanic acid biosynthesis glycosyl transferase WcaI